MKGKRRQSDVSSLRRGGDWGRPSTPREHRAVLAPSLSLYLFFILTIVFFFFIASVFIAVNPTPYFCCRLCRSAPDSLLRYDESQQFASNDSLFFGKLVQDQSQEPQTVNFYPWLRVCHVSLPMDPLCKSKVSMCLSPRSSWVIWSSSLSPDLDPT